LTAKPLQDASSAARYSPQRFATTATSASEHLPTPLRGRDVPPPSGGTKRRTPSRSTARRWPSSSASWPDRRSTAHISSIACAAPPPRSPPRRTAVSGTSRSPGESLYVGGLPLGRKAGGFLFHHTRHTATANLRSGGWMRPMRWPSPATSRPTSSALRQREHRALRERL